MGQYRLHEYQCIMSIVSQYSDASLLKSIRSLNILYDHCVTESDEDNLLEYRFKIITIVQQGFSMSFLNIYPLQKTFY